VTSSPTQPKRPTTLDVLRSFWAELLDVPQHAVTADTDLFAHGADSMDVLYLETRIEAWFRIDLPDHAVIEAPTPSEMADLVQECIDRHGMAPIVAPNNLTVSVTRGAEGIAPLFVAPGAVGPNPVNVAWLARHLSGQRGVTSLVTELPPASAATDPEAWFTHVCQTWLAGIRAIAPAGPWRIMAICMGAPYAWEVSRILSHDGDVAIFLLDPYFGNPDLSLSEEEAVAIGEQGIRRFVFSHRAPTPADLDLTLLLTPNWDHRAAAETYASLTTRTPTIRFLASSSTGHGLAARTIAPIAAEVQIWLAARDLAPPAMPDAGAARRP
jgi:acyl carrier protein